MNLDVQTCKRLIGGILSLLLQRVSSPCTDGRVDVDVDGFDGDVDIDVWTSIRRKFLVGFYAIEVFVK